MESGLHNVSWMGPHTTKSNPDPDTTKGWGSASSPPTSSSVYMRIFHTFFMGFSEEKLGCTHYFKQGWYCSTSKQMIPSRVKEWSANHVLSRLLLQDLVIARSRQKKSLGKLKKRNTLETMQWEEHMMWLKQKIKCDLRRTVIVGHFATRKQGIRSLKKVCAITWTIKDNKDAQLVVKCANWKL